MLKNKYQVNFSKGNNNLRKVLGFESRIYIDHYNEHLQYIAFSLTSHPVRRLLKKMSYTNVKVSISDGEKAKLKSGLQSGEAVSIRLSHRNFSGEDILALTNAQVTKMTKAYQDGKGGNVQDE